jgi:hypothetical protein
LPDDDDDDDEDEYSEEEEETSNHYNADMTLQSKKKKRGNSLKANLSDYTMRLGYVGRVEEANRPDIDSHADCCVCGKEVLFSMILTGRSQLLVGTHKEKPSHCG